MIFVTAFSDSIRNDSYVVKLFKYYDGSQKKKIRLRDWIAVLRHGEVWNIQLPLWDDRMTAL